MSVESEILRIQHNIANTYAAVADKGGTVPTQPTSANLAAAVASIPVGVTQEELSQALLTKQDKLVGAPGQVVGFDGMGLAYAVPGWSNPNLLDNWYFVDPVNQQGETEYTAAAYTIDRFILQNLTGEASVKIEDGCFKLYAKNNDGLLQRFEIGMLLYDTVYTCSILTKNYDLLTVAIKTPPPGSTNVTVVPYPGTIWNLAIGFPSDDRIGYCWPAVTYNQTSLSEIDIVAIKLELGPVQTLAHQDADGNWVLNDPPPNKALELAKCQRYFRAYDGGRIRVYNFTDISRAAYDFCNVIFDQPMRVTPTGTVTYRLNDGEPQTAQLFTAMCGNQKITPDIQIPAGQRVDIVSYAVSADL